MITKKIHKVPLYPCKVEFLIFDSIDEVKELRPERDNYLCFCDIFQDGYVRIGINSKSKIGHVAHECHHAKSAIWDYIGYEPKSDNDEVDAYLISWLVDTTFKFLSKHIESTINK